MKTNLLCLFSGVALIATPAIAGPKYPVAGGFTVQPIADARLRYEGVDQDGFSRNADAVSLRVRAGLEVAHGPWSALAEAEGTLAVHEGYNSGVNDKGFYPIVPDPENVELNRLQIQYRGLPGAVVTVGRQRINLDDQRFVGSVSWRQNEQTFDAARLEWAILPKLKLDATYSWSVRTIWGVDGFGARQQAISGDNVLTQLAWTTPIGMLTGFAYLVDQDEAAISGFRMSSRTFGGRLQGSRPLSPKIKLNYLLSYARQSDYHHNPNDYSADYWLIDVGLDIAALKIGAGYEVLGADDGVALTSFQTPLATLHKFQGWADKFLVTPPNGIRDLYGSAGYGWTRLAGFDAITVSAIYHRFESDRLDQHYGDEIDLIATTKRGKWTFLLKYADYRAEDFGADTQKLWASVEWAF